MNREEKIIRMKRISQAYRLLMGETVAINEVEHTVVPVPRNSKVGVCELCDYQGECPFVVGQVCTLLIPTEDTNFTLSILKVSKDATERPCDCCNVDSNCKDYVLETCRCLDSDDEFQYELWQII